jgi:hypothetical protein
MGKQKYEAPKLNIDKFNSEFIMTASAGEDENAVVKQMLERQSYGWFDL